MFSLCPAAPWELALCLPGNSSVVDSPSVSFDTTLLSRGVKSYSCQVGLKVWNFHMVPSQRGAQIIADFRRCKSQLYPSFDTVMDVVLGYSIIVCVSIELRDAQVIGKTLFLDVSVEVFLGENSG